MPQHDTKKAPTSPEYDCKTTEIRVIIKEEEEGWTVSENREWLNLKYLHHLNTYTKIYLLMIFTFLFVFLNTDEGFRSAGEKEETSTHSCPPDVKACGTESSGCSSTREERPTHMLTDSEEKPRISCIGGKSDGSVTVHQGNNTEEKPFCCETNPGQKRNMKSCQRQHAGEESQEQSLHVKQSTSTTEEAETKRSAPCQTVCKHSYCGRSG